MLVVSAVGWLPAQTFKSRADSVRVDALVTVDGRPLLGLTAADFEVRDNGTPQQVTMLGAGSLPLSVTLLLDMSGSLREERLDALRVAGKTLLDRLAPEDRVALTTFSYDVEALQPLTADFSAVRRSLDTITSEGPTALVDAMYAAATVAEAGERRHLLIVFSDGLDTTSWLDSDAVIRAAQRSETVVYGVTTAVRWRIPPPLREVSEATGGSVLEVDSSSLPNAFARILDEFRQRYILSYTLPGDPSKGWHRIDVRVKRPGTKVKTRAGYTVR
jgi:Ca-activated chloride channel family protein